MKRGILEIFKIEQIYYKSFVRVIFVILVVLNLTTYLGIVGDNDFSNFWNWYDKFNDAISNGELGKSIRLIQHIDLSVGNIICLSYSIFIEFITFLCAILYSALYIKSYRYEKGIDSISIGKIVGRLLVFSLLFVILFIPGSILVLSLFVFFIIILPYAIMYPACYLSGDYGLFQSFEKMITKTKRVYMTNFKNLFLLFVVSILANLIISVIGSISGVAGFVAQSFVFVIMFLSLGRSIGMAYCSLSYSERVN